MVHFDELRQFQAIRITNPVIEHLYDKVGYVAGYSADGWVKISINRDVYILDFDEVELVRT